MAKQLVLFSIDGMRPGGLEQADTPNMDRLRSTGASTLTARTVMPSVTLPCHMSLFHGVTPARHGITTNLFTPQVRPVPGLVDVLSQAGLITAFFYNWEELRDLARPGSLHASYFVKDVTGDAVPDTEVAELASRWLGQNNFNFAFVYLGGVDVAGHAYGWMSDGYLTAIEHADRCIGTVVDALPEACTVIVTSDHGGHDQTHGTEAVEDMTTPLILAGPDVAGPSTIQQAVQITDIAPTILHFFGLEAPKEWIGEQIRI